MKKKNYNWKIIKLIQPKPKMLCRCWCRLAIFFIVFPCNIDNLQLQSVWSIALEKEWIVVVCVFVCACVCVSVSASVWRKAQVTPREKTLWIFSVALCCWEWKAQRNKSATQAWCICVCVFVVRGNKSNSSIQQHPNMTVQKQQQYEWHHVYIVQKHPAVGL